MYNSKGSLKNWNKEDFQQEMMLQYEAMCSTGTTQEERSQIIQKAFLLVHCCAEEDKSMFQSHWNEMIKRNFMIMELEISKVRSDE